MLAAVLTRLTQTTRRDGAQPLRSVSDLRFARSPEVETEKL